MNHPTKPKTWVLASRPKTLPAAVTPVLIASGLAVHEGVFHLGSVFAAMICALLIQIGTNFANDLMDFRAGTDTPDRLGPRRAVASGWLSEREMFLGTVLTLSLTIPPGLYLIFRGGSVVLGIGLLSILAGLAYTGGPYPLAYHGLGDLFVFLFFGLVATVGTFYVQAIYVNPESIVVAVPAGALITNILVVNNYRDIPTDRTAGKHTLAVLIGESWTRIEYLVLLVVSYAVPVWLYVVEEYTVIVLAPLLSLPLGFKITNDLYGRKTGGQLNVTLEQTAQFSLFFGILFAVGLAA